MITWSVRLAVAAFALAGCGPDVIHEHETTPCARQFDWGERELCQRVQREFACVDPGIEITPLGASGYRTRACGRTDVYVCVYSAGGYACTRQAADPPSPDAGR